MPPWVSMNQLADGAKAQEYWEQNQKKFLMICQVDVVADDAGKDDISSSDWIALR